MLNTFLLLSDTLVMRKSYLLRMSLTITQFFFFFRFNCLFDAKSQGEISKITALLVTEQELDQWLSRVCHFTCLNFSWNNSHFFPHYGKSGIFVVGVEVTKATVETDMLGNDFH